MSVVDPLAAGARDARAAEEIASTDLVGATLSIATTAPPRGPGGLDHAAAIAAVPERVQIGHGSGTTSQPRDARHEAATGDEISGAGDLGLAPF